MVKNVKNEKSPAERVSCMIPVLITPSENEAVRAAAAASLHSNSTWIRIAIREKLARAREKN